MVGIKSSQGDGSTRSRDHLLVLPLLPGSDDVILDLDKGNPLHFSRAPELGKRMNQNGGILSQRRWNFALLRSVENRESRPFRGVDVSVGLERILCL